jgi:hypothetical protein
LPSRPGAALPLATAARSLVNALERGWRLRHDGDLDGVEFRLASPASLSDTFDSRVTILPYRLDLDPRRVVNRTPATAGGSPRQALGMEMRFLLIAWFSDPERELQVLGACIDILDQTPVLEGPFISPVGDAPADVQLVVSIDALPPEEMFRLWDALAPSYRLSVPYVVRTVRIGTRDVTDVPPVDAVARGYRARVPP